MKIGRLEGGAAASVKELNKTAIRIEKSLKEVIRRNLNKIEKIEARTRSCMEKFSKRMSMLEKNERAIKEALAAQKQAFIGIEDTFFTLYHNIKRNQFLYVEEPEIWWDDYLDLKKHYSSQNEDYKTDVINHKLTKIIEEINEMGKK